MRAEFRPAASRERRKNSHEMVDSIAASQGRESPSDIHAEIVGNATMPRRRRLSPASADYLAEIGVAGDARKTKHGGFELLAGERSEQRLAIDHVGVTCVTSYP